MLTPPPHPPKKPTGTRESTLQRTLVLGFPVFQTVPVQECIPVTIIPSEIISVEYNDSLRGRGEDAPRRAWPYLREFLPSPSFTKLESCATDAQHKTWGLNTRKSTMVLLLFLMALGSLDGSQTPVLICRHTTNMPACLCRPHFLDFPTWCWESGMKPGPLSSLHLVQADKGGQSVLEWPWGFSTDFYQRWPS